MGRSFDSGVFESGVFRSGTFQGAGAILSFNRLQPTMALIDHVDLGGNLIFVVLTEDASGIPTNADSPPTYDILSVNQSTVLVDDGSTTLLSGRTGAYRVNQPITAALGFASGETYTLIASWAISGFSRQRQYTLKVV